MSLSLYLYIWFLPSCLLQVEVSWLLINAESIWKESFLQVLLNPSTSLVTGLYCRPGLCQEILFIFTAHCWKNLQFFMLPAAGNRHPTFWPLTISWITPPAGLLFMNVYPKIPSCPPLASFFCHLSGCNQAICAYVDLHLALSFISHSVNMQNASFLLHLCSFQIFKSHHLMNGWIHTSQLVGAISDFV